MADVQILPGKCPLLSDPVVRSINDLTADARGRFLVNYEILGNSDPVLHAHVTPRYAWEPEERRKSPAWFYDFPQQHISTQTSTARCKRESLEPSLNSVST